MFQPVPALSLCIALSLGNSVLQAQDVRCAAPNTLESPIAAGSVLRLKLSAGGYRIRPGLAQDKVTVTWHTERSHSTHRASVSIKNQGSGTLLVAKGPKDNFEVDIEVPARLDLDVDMSVGDLSISGIEGHKRIDLNIGDIRIDIGKAENYKSARGSLKIGDIDAKPFQAHHEGFFRSFDWKGSGAYQLDVRLGIGDITLFTKESGPGSQALSMPEHRPAAGSVPGL